MRMLPSLSAPSDIGDHAELGRAVRAPLFRLIFGAALVSLLCSPHRLRLQLLPKKHGGAACGPLQLGNCLLLAIVGYVLAAIWRELIDWRQPRASAMGRQVAESRAVE